MAGSTDADPRRRFTAPRAIVEAVLGATLAFTGAAHLTSAREAFRAQVPGWFPVDEDLVVVVSGVVEIVLGAGLLAVLLPVLAAGGWVSVSPLLPSLF